jgi:hypothetical protein
MKRTHWNSTRQISTGDTIRAELGRLHVIIESGRGDPFARVDAIANLIGTRAAHSVVARSLELREQGVGPICDAQIDMLIWAASDPAIRNRPTL